MRSAVVPPRLKDRAGTRGRDVLRGTDIRVPMEAGTDDGEQPTAVACYMGDLAGETFSLSAVNVLTLRGHEIVEMNGFIGPAAQRPFDLPPEAPR
ncbi:MAG: hypothetical protein ACJ72W_11865 [Actinoallomurus sp.]